MGTTSSKTAASEPAGHHRSASRGISSASPTVKPVCPDPEKRGQYVAAIDQGTTSSRFLIFDKEGMPHASHQVEFEQLYPHAG